MFWSNIYNSICDFAIWLYTKFDIEWLYNRVDFTIMSTKDQKIYNDLSDKYSMTDFEWKIIQNTAYHESFTPNETNVIGRPTDSAEAKIYDESTSEVGYNVNDSLWSLEELINLAAYRVEGPKRDRILELAEYYSKHYVLMVLGIEK